MEIKELVKLVEPITDEKGKKKAVIDWPVWEEIVAILEEQFDPKTELGRKLWEARAKILASGTPVLNESQLEYEITTRRGD